MTGSILIQGQAGNSRVVFIKDDLPTEVNEEILNDVQYALSAAETHRSPNEHQIDWLKLWLAGYKLLTKPEGLAPVQPLVSQQEIDKAVEKNKVDDLVKQKQIDDEAKEKEHLQHLSHGNFTKAEIDNANGEVITKDTEINRSHPDNNTLTLDEKIAKFKAEQASKT
jgi:hypothetical protein